MQAGPNGVDDARLRLGCGVDAIGEAGRSAKPSIRKGTSGTFFASATSVKTSAKRRV
jgi:hypothetical protein